MHAHKTSTVTDRFSRPIRDLRISLIDRCNLRCTYCMPREVFGPDYAFLPRSEWLDFDQIERLTRSFVDIGVRKLRLTGGEPLLRPNLPDLVHRLSSIPKVEDIALTTNGFRLAPFAEEFKQAGLDRITVSLDALDADIFKQLSGVELPPDRVLDGIDAALACGFKPKINMVVLRGVNESEILPMARRFNKLDVPVRYIEYMDVGNGQQWEESNVVPTKEVLELLRTEFPLESRAPASTGEVARRYGIPGESWEVGFISSITAPFCRDCNRARISADGKLYTCLFATEGTDLKPVLEKSGDDSALGEQLSRLWQLRDDRYSELRGAKKEEADKGSKVPMSYIGG